MAEINTDQALVDRFILEQVDTVPHLEGLLLLWNTRPRPWTPDDLSKRLFLTSEAGERIMRDLAHKGFAAVAAGSPGCFAFNDCSPERNQLLEEVERAYRREVIRISKLIHSKSPNAVREFARAFRLKKD